MGFQFTRKLTIEWGHCDPAGIVFNPRFFEFFDWSTALLVRAALGVEKADMVAAYGIVGIPVVDTRATFLRPSRYGEEIEIVSSVTAVGRSSFEIAHKLFNKAELAVEGHEKRVWTIRDARDGRLKSQVLPEDVARKLSGA
ncbi:thioesterase family protein [Methylocapsa sp. S129]|uniref:acyl-CoA thioesterase n=1 Tax=Methylocapsa sp. S129 TaxID=1641869 RepID=UPI00131B2719|nr:thioesterase family protein [Methylocapsa sp. S129]